MISTIYRMRAEYLNMDVAIPAYIYSESKNIAIVLIPKNGSASLEGWASDDYKVHDFSCYNWEQEVFNKDTLFIVILRDPILRLKSAINMLETQRVFFNTGVHSVFKENFQSTMDMHLVPQFAHLPIITNDKILNKIKEIDVEWREVYAKLALCRLLPKKIKFFYMQPHVSTMYEMAEFVGEPTLKNIWANKGDNYIDQNYDQEFLKHLYNVYECDDNMIESLTFQNI